MPHYYFNVHDGQTFPDEDGTDLPSLDAARAHAGKYAGELLQTSVEQLWSGEEWKMEVTDERGLILFCLLFTAIDAPVLTRERPGAA